MQHKIYEILKAVWRPADGDWYWDPATSEFLKRRRFARLVELFRPEDGAWLAENVRSLRVLDDYVNAALTVANQKKEWINTRPTKLVGVRFNSGGAGVGAGSSTADIMQAGVTLYTTNAKPTIATAATGDWTVLPPDNPGALLKAGDVIEWRVTAIPATSGHTRTALALLLKHV